MMSLGSGRTFLAGVELEEVGYPGLGIAAKSCLRP